VVPSSTTANAKILNAVCRSLSFPQRHTDLRFQSLFRPSTPRSLQLSAFCCPLLLLLFFCCRRRCCRSCSAALIAYESAYELAYELSITLLQCYRTHHRALFNAHIVLTVTLFPGLQRNCLSLISSDGYSRWTRNPAGRCELAGDPRLPQ
jgi:hypothetical protein